LRVSAAGPPIPPDSEVFEGPPLGSPPFNGEEEDYPSGVSSPVPIPGFGAVTPPGGGGASSIPPSSGFTLGGFASSPWFGLASGLASILGLLLTLYGTQVRTIPFSYYRSLTWRRSLLISISFGSFLLALINFYNQYAPPAAFPLFKAYELLHGDVDYDYSSGTSIWGLLAGVSLVIFFVGLNYDPLTKLRAAIRQEHTVLMEARRRELNSLLSGRSFERLSTEERALHKDIESYYRYLQARFRDIMLGAASPSIIHPSAWRPAFPSLSAASMQEAPSRTSEVEP
jgi:hypothetical protein